MVLVVVAGVVLTLVGVLYPGSPPQHAILASRFLAGHLDVPAGVYDEVPFRGHYFLPFGPLPAALLVPVVAFLGGGTPNVILAVPAALLTLPGFDAMWTGLGWRDVRDRRWLTLCTAGGTVWICAVAMNSSYFVNHVLVIACLVWAVALAVRGRLPAVAGVLVGLATLTRSSALLALLPLAALYATHTASPRARASAMGALLGGFLPCLLLTFGYNFARFGSPMEAGYTYQNLTFAPLVAARSAGLFSLAHVPKNLYYLLVAGPLPIGGENAGTLAFPWVVPSRWGMGLLWVSPWLLVGFFARGRVALIMATGAIVMLVPDLLYYGIGWIQFGYRYALDALPFLAGWAAIGMKDARTRPWVVGTGLYSIAINLAGTGWLLHEIANFKG